MKLCIDCKWCVSSYCEIQSSGRSFTYVTVPAKCSFPEIVSRVNGIAVEDAATVRNRSLECGSEAKWFEQKNYKEELNAAKAEIKNLTAKLEEAEKPKPSRRFLLWSP